MKIGLTILVAIIGVLAGCKPDAKPPATVSAHTPPAKSALATPVPQTTTPADNGLITREYFLANIRLGMTRQEVNQVFGSTCEDVEWYGREEGPLIAYPIVDSSGKRQNCVLLEFTSKSKYDYKRGGFVATTTLARWISWNNMKFVKCRGILTDYAERGFGGSSGEMYWDGAAPVATFSLLLPKEYADRKIDIFSAA